MYTYVRSGNTIALLAPIRAFLKNKFFASPKTIWGVIAASATPNPLHILGRHDVN